MSEGFTDDEIAVVMKLNVLELSDSHLDKVISFERKAYLGARAGIKPKKDELPNINLFALGLKKPIDNSDLGDI